MRQGVPLKREKATGKVAIKRQAQGKREEQNQGERLTHKMKNKHQARERGELSHMRAEVKRKVKISYHERSVPKCAKV